MTQSLQVRVQKFGAVLSAMVMPNIGVFIGWGLLAALFIDTGWIPNKFLGALVSPILTYLLPILLGYTAGSNFYGRRGGVIGAFATIGVIIGSDITMLIGGMVMGPIAAKILEKFDNAVKEKIPTGMEMMVDNFSLGILGAILCAIGYAGVAPVMTTIQGILGGAIETYPDAQQLHGSEGIRPHRAGNPVDACRCACVSCTDRSRSSNGAGNNDNAAHPRAEEGKHCARREVLRQARSHQRMCRFAHRRRLCRRKLPQGHDRP